MGGQQVTSVSVVVPTWNRADLLGEMLASLARQTQPAVEILVVDNGSTDNTADVCREFNARLLPMGRNAGFAGAVNEGVRAASGEWILLANNDVVFQPEWLERILVSTDRSGAKFATGKLLQKADERRLDGTWDMLSRGAHAWRCGFGRLDGEPWSQTRQIRFAPMTAALFHRSVFEEVGLLDTRFEAYYEDVDFGIRCAAAGIPGIYEPSAVGVHKGTSTLGKHGKRVWYLTCRNQVLLLAKHYSRRMLRRFAWPIFVGQTLSVLAAASHGLFFTALKAKIDGLRLWKQFRSENASGVSAFEAALTRSEAELRQIQERIGFDPYWRIYFSLVRS